MERIPVEGGELEGRIDGTGEPLLCIHGSVIADTFHCLRIRPEVTGRYRLITYNRRGFAGSAHHTGPFSIRQQAADAAAVLRHFGVERAHVAGHSYGGATALQLALDAPSLVRSLTLLEPALFNVPSGEEDVGAADPVVAIFQAGDSAGAVAAFLDMAFDNTDWRPRVEGNLPHGWWEQSVADAATLFEVEFPAIGEWLFSEAEAKRVNVPVLSILGGLSGAFFQEGQEMMKGWWPQIECATLPGAAHDLQYANPGGAAEVMLKFLTKHPMN